MKEANELLEKIEEAATELIENVHGFDAEDQAAILANVSELLNEQADKAEEAITDHEDDYNAYMDHLERGFSQMDGGGWE